MQFKARVKKGFVSYPRNPHNTILLSVFGGYWTVEPCQMRYFKESSDAVARLISYYNSRFGSALNCKFSQCFRPALLPPKQQVLFLPPAQVWLRPACFPPPKPSARINLPFFPLPVNAGNPRGATLRTSPDRLLHRRGSGR